VSWEENKVLGEGDLLTSYCLERDSSPRVGGMVGRKLNPRGRKEISFVKGRGLKKVKIAALLRSRADVEVVPSR